MSAPGPVRRTRVSTNDPDEATELQQGYGAFQAEPIDAEGFEFTLEAASTGAVGVSHMRHSARFSGRGEPPPTLIAMESVDHSEMWASDRRLHAAGELLLTPLWSEWSAGWNDIRMRITTLDLGEIARVGAETSQLSRDQVRFDGMSPLSPALARYWSRIVDYVEQHVLATDELMSSPLVVGNIVQMLATAALAVFPNSTQDHHHHGRASGAPATVRRAMQFMDAHAREDIDITRIAEASGLGPRGLQSAFRRHRDQTPLEYLRRVRLEGAHRDLQRGDPTRGDTVAAISARWGFTHPGRFSVDYHRVYGRSPSETLRD